MFWLISMLALGSTLLAWPHWQAIRAQDAWLISGVGLTGFCGQWGVTYAFRHGEVSAIAPFEYTSLIWSLGLDRIIWRHHARSLHAARCGDHHGGGTVPGAAVKKSTPRSSILKEPRAHSPGVA